MEVEQTVEPDPPPDRTSKNLRKKSEPWNAERDAVLRSELERGASYRQAAEKVNETHGTAYPDRMAACRAYRIGARSKLPAGRPYQQADASPSGGPSRRRLAQEHNKKRAFAWRPEHDEALRSIVADGLPYAEVSEELGRRFTDRSFGTVAVVSRANRLRIKIGNHLATCGRKSTTRRCARSLPKAKWARAKRRADDAAPLRRGLPPRPWTPQLQPWEGPFAGPHQRLPRPRTWPPSGRRHTRAAEDCADDREGGG